MNLQNFLDSVSAYDPENGVDLTTIVMKDNDGRMAMYLEAFPEEGGDIIICDIDKKGLEFKIEKSLSQKINEFVKTPEHKKKAKETLKEIKEEESKLNNK